MSKKSLIQRFTKPPHIKLPNNVVNELSIITMLIAVGLVIFAQVRQFNQGTFEILNAQVTDLNLEIEDLKNESNQWQQENDRLLEAYHKVSTDSAVLANEEWTSAKDLYTSLDFKYNEYTQKGLDLSEYESEMPKVLTMLLKGKYDELGTKVTDLDENFEKLMAFKIEEDKKKAAAAAAAKAAVSAPVTSNPGSGYSRITVATEKGNFVTNLVMVNLNSVQVITVTGNDGNCDNNCVTKPLATYVAENSGFAGINGTYFCPPDYSSCAGKVNSYDFPVYSTKHSKWINADKLFWNARAMMAFAGSSARYCGSANSCDSGGITAGIVNYPNLINGGQIADFGGLSDSLKNVKGFRGAIGVRDNFLYLMMVRGASVTDVAYVMKALGIQHGMNLDGGGSSALYFNGYKVGPGRSLPNAVVLKYK